MGCLLAGRSGEHDGLPTRRRRVRARYLPRHGVRTCISTSSCPPLRMLSLMSPSYLAETDAELRRVQVHAHDQLLARLALVVDGAGGARLGWRQQPEAPPELPQRKELGEALLVHPHHCQDLRASQLQTDTRQSAPKYKRAETAVVPEQTYYTTPRHQPGSAAGGC